MRRLIAGGIASMTVRTDLPVLAALALVIVVGLIRVHPTDRGPTSVSDRALVIVSWGASGLLAAMAKHVVWQQLVGVLVRGDRVTPMDIGVLIAVVGWATAAAIAVRGIARYRGRHRR